MKSLRLLVLTNGNYIFGAERVTLDILKGLKERGYVLHCIVSGWNDGHFIRLLEEMQIGYSVTKLGWYYVSQIKWSLDSLVHYPGAVWHFLTKRKQFKHDFIYVTSFRQIVLLFPFLKKNIIYHVHDNNGHKRQSRFFLKRIDKKVLQYIAVSNYIKEDLISCGIPAEKIRVIYNGIQIKPLFAQKKENKFTIGVVGQVISTKGHHTVLDAFKILKDKGLNIQLFIVGRGNEKLIESLKEKIETYGITGDVFWKGFKNTLPEVYEGIDLVVAPSTLSEAFGLMACEANMFKVPSIVTNRGGQPEIIKDGYNGFVVDPTNPQEIADKIELLYHNPDMLKTMGENGRKRVMEIFSIEKMNTDFTQLVESLTIPA